MATIYLGTTYQAQAVAYDAPAPDGVALAPRTTRWWVADSAVAMVDAVGLLTPVALGTTTLYAQDIALGIRASATLTVAVPTVGMVLLEPPDAGLLLLSPLPGLVLVDPLPGNPVSIELTPATLP